MKVSKGAKQAQHREYWTLQVSKLALLNAAAYEDVRIKCHAIDSKSMYVHRFQAGRIESDALQVLGLLTGDQFKDMRNARYLMRAARRVTPKPAPLPRPDKSLGELARMYGSKVALQNIPKVAAMDFSDIESRVMAHLDDKVNALDAGMEGTLWPKK